MNRTTAPASSAGQYVDDNPSLSVTGTLLIAADRNMIQEELCAPIEGAGITLSAGDDAQLWKAIRKTVVERGKPVGEIFALLDRRAPVAFGAGTEDTYFPALCLTSIASYTDITTGNWPDLVPYLRGLKSIFKDGLSGEISSPVVTAWAISSNVATLTLQNDADHIALLNALSEDATVHGGFTNWRTVTLASSIGTISAGTYNITAIAPMSRTLSFAYTAVDGSGSVTSAVDFYAFRIAGSATSARVWTARGLGVHGVGDDNGYFVSGGIRTRDRMQGHEHELESSLGVFNDGVYGTGDNKAGRNITTSANATTKTILAANTITDGTNGTPRPGKTTHSPSIGAHLYIHGGRYAV